MRLFLCALSLAVPIFADTGFLINDDNGNPIQPQIQSEPPLRQLTEEKPPLYPQQQGILPTMSEAEMIKMIKEEAEGQSIDKLLALSIVKVESNFNPYAVSVSNALGLMQLKMDTAVKDVYVLSYLKETLPPSEILFDPRVNVRLGVAYLYLIQNRFFREITDKKSLEYCTIAAYNAGAGTVLRTFHKDKGEAVKIINAIGSDEVLKRLTGEMDSMQGRRYVQKVLDAKKYFRATEKPALVFGENLEQTQQPQPPQDN